MSEPLIVGIRHHSPACARLVKSLIESQRPRYVLIEGPADFNDRVDELFLAHQLPVAIYSYCQYQDGAAPGRGAWTPFAEFSPEWQALQAARRIQAQTYFIDLPCWAQSEEEDDSPDTQDESQTLLLRATRMDNSDTLWDHLFEDESQQTALPSTLAHYFAQLRGDSPGDALNRQREAFMARWITWAMQQNNGDVLVVCGGWHAPALAKMWRKCPQEMNKPELSSLADGVTGCYLTPYSEKRLDVLAGYLSGMPAPVWQNWCWQCGLQQAGEQLLKTVLTRLRQHKLPASTADMAAAHLHAMALAQLRGHTLPLRTDWLDAIAGSLIKEALNAPLPWSYRGVIHPDTDPILLTVIDTLAGDGFGKLSPSTPQPPLPKDVTCELERTGISLPAELTLNRFTPDGLAQSQVLHRLAILEIPGVVRQQGSTLTLAGNGEECWKLTRPLSQHAALIEAACFGATLQEAARHKLEADMLDAGGIGCITTCLSQAALAGLASFSQQLLEQLTLLIAQENQFAEMGQALEVLYALWRLDEISGMQGAQILQTTLCAAIDRTLWLCESNGRPDEKEFHAHLHSWQALCHILRDLHSGVNLPGVSLSAAVALLERRSQAIHAPALDRGATLGALMRLEHPNASAEAALTMLAQLSPAQSGEALHGLLALARHQLACQPVFIAGFVKRSLKELENGNVPEISHENGALIATFSDGVRTQLANGQALKEAQCTCGASGMCRHRVMLVLSYQRLCATAQPTEKKEEEWDPAIWLKELANLPDATRKRAQALVAKGITIELFCAPGEIPSARLPMSDVRFYSRSSIRFARCDCIEGTLCEHVVLAVQAFVEAKTQQAEFTHLIWQMRSEHVTSSDDPFASEEGKTCRQYVQQLSQALWLGGISQPPIHYEAAFSRAQQAAERCNWRWVSESLRQLRASVDAFHARASHYHAGECLRQLAALNSRLNCVQEMARRDSIGEVPPMPWRTVVGAGIAGEAKLDHLRLVSLGMRCWQDIEQYGLRIWFTDPDTGSILHLSRSWQRSEQENSPAATRRLFSFQAGALAGGQIVSQAAKRSADGELLLATRNRLSSVVPLSPDAWQMLSAPLRQPGIVALREYLRQRPPACIRPLNQVDNLFILPVAECISLGWDSSRQTLDAQVISGEGEDNVLTLSLPASACSPFAVERMAALLQQTDDPVSLVSGFVSFVEGQLTLEPRVMMTKTRAWALDAETAPVAPLPSASVLPVPSTAHQLLMRCQALLIQLLHNGWRYQEQSAIGEAELLANDLTAVGFYRLAHVLGQFRNTESEARVEAMNNGVLLCEQLFPMLQQQG